ncbi:unnamed protein product, partial [Owenia fusiformis]
MEADDPLKVNQIEMDGTFESFNPIDILVSTVGEDLSISIGNSATMVFDKDTAVNNNGPYSGSSSITANTLTTGSSSSLRFHQCTIQINAISISGTVYGSIDGDLEVDTFSVSNTGAVYLMNQVKFTGKSSARTESITLNGRLNLDYDVTHNGNSWSGLGSNFNIDNLLCEHSSGRFVGGLLELTTSMASIDMVSGCQFEFWPLEDLVYTVAAVNVKSGATMTTHREFERFSGNSLTVGGTLDLDYKCPVVTDAGCYRSELVWDTITVTGNLRAGTLEIDATTLTVSGTIDVTEGGYTADEGPGAGTPHSSGGTGATHASRGGRSHYVTTDVVYIGTFDTFTEWGSGGATAGGHAGGRGGGYIKATIQDLVNNGNINLNGAIGVNGHAGGGAGGCFYADISGSFTGTGYITSNGGQGRSYGGGGSGGRIIVNYQSGGFVSGHAISKGGPAGGSGNSEPGGPGMTYFHKTSLPEYKELRVDNGCQSPRVTMPSGTTATQTEYDSYIETGAIAHLMEASSWTFDIIGIYGGAHLTYDGGNSTLTSTRIVGDDTGYLHVAPWNTLEWTEVSEWRRVNMTWQPYIYENALFILPTAMVEIRQVLDQQGLGINSAMCTSGYLTSSTRQFWGTVQSDNAHVFIGYGATVIMQLPSLRHLDMVGLTIQDGGVLDFRSDDNDLDDQWTLQVIADDLEGDRDGKIRVEGGGEIKAKALYIYSIYLDVDHEGVIQADYQGNLAGVGQGEGYCGGGYGGKGGNSHSASQQPGPVYGNIYEPREFGSGGGSSSASNGRGGGVLKITTANTMIIDGIVSCNGQAGTSHIGGGSGGSIYLDLHHIKGYGAFQVIGGDGFVHSSHSGGGGSGGRIAMYFNSNKTYAGSWDLYGGLGGGYGSAYDGASGTAFFYHQVHDHTTLLINNNMRGAATTTEVAIGNGDYTSLSTDQGKTWFLPISGDHTFSGDNDYKFDEMQIWGQGQLAILTEPVDSNATIFFDNMIGDRTGAIHVGPNQIMDLERPQIDLPFGAHIYDGGFLGLAPDTIVHGVDIWISGILAHVENLTIHHGGQMLLHQLGRTEGNDATYYNFHWVHVQDLGYIDMVSDPVNEPGVNFIVTFMHIDGGGDVGGTHVYIHAENITVDAGGALHADSLGYRTSDNYDENAGLHGIVNPGKGTSTNYYASGGGHGGSGGRGRGDADVIAPNGISSSGTRSGSSTSWGNLYSSHSYTWCPYHYTSSGRWLKTTYSKAYYFTHVETRGNPHFGGWVTQYEVHYIDAETGQKVTYKKKDSLDTWRFPGNTDTSTYLKQEFDEPIYTSQVWIYPIAWSNIIGLGMQFYGHDGLVETAGQAYDDLYEPTDFGSAGGGPAGGRGGGKIWFNVTDTIHIDGVVSSNGGAGISSGTAVSGGGSGGSVWMHAMRITGYGQLQAKGGAGSTVNDRCGGGGSGGRVALYFQQNDTFSDFRYLPAGGLPGHLCHQCEAGGAGTVFIYNMLENHRTLVIDNDNAPHPDQIYVNWEDTTRDGGRTWIMPLSGVHDFASGQHNFHFEELQIYGNAHLAVMPPDVTYDGENYIISPQFVDGNPTFTSSSAYNVSIFFNYMIGDRSGTMHVYDRQDLDLQRDEIDLPFNTYVYDGGHLGLAPDTYVHGVDIHMAGRLSYVRNLTLHHEGFFWCKHLGHTTGDINNTYSFYQVRIQDDSSMNATTDPVSEPGITFDVGAFTVEGGGTLHGTFMTFNVENITVDDGGLIAADGLGYYFTHRNDSHGEDSLHGSVNVGIPTDASTGRGSGGGHGGSGGRGTFNSNHNSGYAYGDLYEPYVFGSAGGASVEGGVPGGTGGGMIWMNVTNMIHIDGEVTCHGGDVADGFGGGGGSGGSIWMYTELIKGYGSIKANGGAGSDGSDSNYRGAGGGGGRIAIYFNVNETMTGFNYHAWGGATGGANAEPGGAGTVFIYAMVQTHRTLIIDNGGQDPKDVEHVLGNYEDISTDGCRTWIHPQSGGHIFSGGADVHDYHFEEIQMYGHAHFAIMTDPPNEETDVHFLYMIGDRTGTVHLGANQTMDLEREEIDLPFSVRVYSHAWLGLAYSTVIHGVSVWLHSTLAHIEDVTLHHGGFLGVFEGGHTLNEDSNVMRIDWVRVQDDSIVQAITDPATENLVTFYMFDLFVEGGAKMIGTQMYINAINITIDDGGEIQSDGQGYRPTDQKNTDTGVNLGTGTTSGSGSSGGGHGGTSGRGGGTASTGQPYGNLFEPTLIGSSGGGGQNYGGNGGGVIWMNVTNILHLDGEIRSNGADAVNYYGGGGSGGSVWIHTELIRGTGNVTANGGGSIGSSGYTGGGGSGGRIAIYFMTNFTYLGGWQCHGGDSNYIAGHHPYYNTEPGGPGTVLMFAEAHDHTTLYINNNDLVSHHVDTLDSYSDLSTDSFKAWMLPAAGEHWLAAGNHQYNFDEFHIYGNAHLAILPEPLESGATLYFVFMIGDRTGHVHIGPDQSMDLERPYLDTPFSTYVYDGGYLGLAPVTDLNSVFVHIEGTLDHIVNLTLVQGGELRMFLTGSTNNYQSLDYEFNGTAIIKAESGITCNGPAAHSEQFNLMFNYLTVEGGGYIQGKHILVNANELTVDDGGLIDVSDGGETANNGEGVGIAHSQGNSGASHAGTGGRGGCSGYKSCRLDRSMPYGNLYEPKKFGSGGAGGNGGNGGGILEIDVTGTLTVDGYISSNSNDIGSSVNDGSSGGSGGSIFINTGNFSGSHTGHIQALGGAGDVAKGGGGSGGRIAIYHYNHITSRPYRGYYDLQGGSPSTYAEPGASGTAFVKHTEDDHITLRVDNRDQFPTVLDDPIRNQGRRLDLSLAAGVGYSKTQSARTYTTASGCTVRSSNGEYHTNYQWQYYPRNNDGNMYKLPNLFDQTFQNSEYQQFMAWGRSTTLTITFPETYFVNHIRVFPNAAYPSRFRVTGALGSSSFDLTSTTVSPASSIKYGSFLRVPAMISLEKVEIYIETTRSDHVNVLDDYASLSELEIWVEGENAESRYEHRELDGIRTWIEPESGTNSYDFDEVYLTGGAHLAFYPMTSLTTPVDIYIGNLNGDKSGHLHIGYEQSVVINETAIDIPFNMHVYESGSADLPARAFFMKTKLYSAGHITGLEDVYVFDGGMVVIDSNSSVGENSVAGQVNIETVHVQDGGTFELKSYDNNDAWELDVVNITVYGGGHFKANAQLNVTATHLFAIYSGGRIDLDHGGFLPGEGFGKGTGAHYGGSGGCHGGSGGRGGGTDIVGESYDSLYSPIHYGSPGGYGASHGTLYFGDEDLENLVVVQGLGGRGGGAIHIDAFHVELDGKITADGEVPHSTYQSLAGGGSGGSILIECDIIAGHGGIYALGGSGDSNGGGGSGGRISVQCDSMDKFNVTTKAYGGASSRESGGAGTVYLQTANATTGDITNRVIIIDNHNREYPQALDWTGPLKNIHQGDYSDISRVGGVTWLFHESQNYVFDDIIVRGNAHVAILSDTDNDDVVVQAERMLGDKSGILHTANKQSFTFENLNVYLPVNIMAYPGSTNKMPVRITLRDVWMENNGTIKQVEDIGIENGGKMHLWSLGHKEGEPNGAYRFENISIRAGGLFEPLTADGASRMALNMTRLTVNGRGVMRCNDIHMEMENMTVDLSGEVHADFTGFASSDGDGQGIDQINGRTLGGSGGAHGGRGGRPASGYYSAMSYGSIYLPNTKGSGGGAPVHGLAGRGGGIFLIEVHETMRIEGRLHSNGEAGQGTHGSGGGGAGGSILVYTHNLDGGGSIEATGGAGQSDLGGGGGGGRIALYYKGDNYYIGEYIVHGGSSRDQYGGAGTVFIEDRTTPEEPHRTFISDNAGYSSTERIAEVEKLDTRGYGVDSSSQTYYTYGNVKFTTTGNVYSYWPYVHHQVWFPFYNLVSGAPTDGYYRTTYQNIDIDIEFPYETYVDHVRIYPQCEDTTTEDTFTNTFMVSSTLDGDEDNHLDSFWSTAHCRVQDEPDHFGTVRIDRNVNKITLNWKSSGSHIGVNELEVYLSEQPGINVQRNYVTTPGSGWITTEDEDVSEFEFEEIHLLGGASLAMTGTDTKILAHSIEGDSSARLEVRKDQIFHTSQDRVVQPFAILAQRDSDLVLPPKYDCKDLDVTIKGTFSKMTNVTVSAECKLTIDHHEPKTNEIDFFDIKTFAEVEVTTADAATTTLVGTVLTVRSGGWLKSQDLELRYTNITVEPNGYLTADEGVPYDIAETGVGVGYRSTSGSSGAGGGGGGGQGQGQIYAGKAHGSFLQPTSFGYNGGHSIFPHMGGLGAGRIHLEISNTFMLDGYLTSRGGQYRSVQAGGGSGGSLFIEAKILGGDGTIDASGGQGYDGSYSNHGGGGGAGRIALYYVDNDFVGAYIAAGGEGGANSENGGPGTIYLHKLPRSETTLLIDKTKANYEEIYEDTTGYDNIEIANRTLYIDNRGRFPLDQNRNLTDGYDDMRQGSATAWALPGSYPSSVVATEFDTEEKPDVVLDEIQVYGGGHIAFIQEDCSTCNIDIRLVGIQGNRQGRIHIGFNQTLFIADGRLPIDMAIYRGGEGTLQGELRVIGVTVRIEGVLKDVENMTIVEGGTLFVSEMVDLNGDRKDTIPFIAINIRNNGKMVANNGIDVRILKGKSLHVFPGGMLESNNLEIIADEVYVDTLASIVSDGLGYASEAGPGKGSRIGANYGSGGSHGGEAGSESTGNEAPIGYGSFTYPRDFGSGGGHGTDTLGYNYDGGAGGGAIKIEAKNVLKIDGNVTASGADGVSGTWSGGGAGGSVYLNTSELDGVGIVGVVGGDGRNGGSGGRISAYYDTSYYIGEFSSSGGSHSGGETGAAGTVFLSDKTTEEKRLQVYNNPNGVQGLRRTRVTIPAVKTEDHNVQVLDLGDYAQVGLVAVDANSIPTTGDRELQVLTVDGDHTAGVHVEPGMWLNIQFNDSAVLSFHVTLYDDAKINLPFETYLKDSRVILYGGELLGLKKLNVSLNGEFIAYPEARLFADYDSEFNLESIEVLDGGILGFEGTAAAEDVMTMSLDALIVRGGGLFYANKLDLTAKTIEIDGQGVIDASGRGYEPGEGSGAGISDAEFKGGSGGSHGGVGGQGSHTTYSSMAYDNVMEPTDYGSGGNKINSEQVGGQGGGVILLSADRIVIDGEIKSNGSTSYTKGCGGGAGGSIVVKAKQVSGSGSVVSSGGDGATVSFCNKYDENLRCEECNNGYYWSDYNCVASCQHTSNECCDQDKYNDACVGSHDACLDSDAHCRSNGYFNFNYCDPIGRTCKGESSPADSKTLGGGGAGGRIAIFASESFTYTGSYRSIGGRSPSEYGGPGTVVVFATDPETEVTTSSLFVDNGGKQPVNDLIADSTQDSCRAYVVADNSFGVSTFDFDEVTITGSAHLAFRSNGGSTITVTFQMLHGDLTGLLHVLQGMPVEIVDGDSPMPASFFLYESAQLQLPAEVFLSGLDYKDVEINGILTGIQDLHIGEGVNIVIGPEGQSAGLDKQEFTMNSVNIYADGVLTSLYGEGATTSRPSLGLTLTEELRLHSGGVIQTNWIRADTGSVLLESASFIQTNARAPTRSDGGRDTPAGGGSGGGHGACGGNGVGQTMVGHPHGILYEPSDFGSQGGIGGAATTGDCYPLYSSEDDVPAAGRGGGIIQLTATGSIEIDGDLFANGEDSQGPRAGGGAGGSIFLSAATEFAGLGTMSAIGGAVDDTDTNCGGGGGGGGRIAIEYDTNNFIGS